MDRLAAQRLLYGQVKNVENLRLASVFFVAILLLSGLAVEVDSFSQWATMAVLLLWFVDQVVLVRCSDRRKQEAAVIQEDFDCFVLEMPWPEHLGIPRPTDDRVKELALRAYESGITTEELTNWYGTEDMPADVVRARQYCQRMNCYWEQRLRKEWIRSVKAVVGVIVVIGCVVGATIGVSLLTVVLGVAAGIRLLAWLFMEQRAQSIALTRMENLHAYLSRAEAKGGQMPSCDVLLVQAAIFEHRRVCATVPDWFYRLKKQNYEGK